MKLKAIILSAPLTIISLVILIVVGIYLILTIRQSDQNNSSLLSDTSSAFQPSSSVQTYTNNQYGFSLTFDEKWQGYKVEESNIRTPNAPKVLAFSLPAKSGVFGKRIVFNLYIYTLNNWQEGRLVVENPLYITQNKKYVFAYKILTPSLLSVDLTKEDIEETIRTFTLNNKSVKSEKPGNTYIGILEPTVEAGGWFLRISKSEGYVLLLGKVYTEEWLKEGSKVQVTGFIDKGVSSIFMQGEHIQVQSIEPLE